MSINFSRYLIPAIGVFLFSQVFHTVEAKTIEVEMRDSGTPVVTLTPVVVQPSPAASLISSPSPLPAEEQSVTPILSPTPLAQDAISPTVTGTTVEDESSDSSESQDNTKEVTPTETPSPMERAIATESTSTSENATPTMTMEPSDASPTPVSSMTVEGAEDTEIPTPTESPVPQVENTPTEVPTATPETGTRNSISIPFEESAAVPVKTKRVRTSQNFSFYSFLSSGFVINDSEPRDILGKVYTFEGDPLMFSKPIEAHVKLDKPARSKVGDLLTIYRLYEQSLNASQSEFQGSWAEIEAVVQIEGIDKDVAQVKILEGFKAFSGGDLARDYGADVKRWKKAQIKKALPMAGIDCFVAGGDPLNSTYRREDTIVLTAGSRKGVVEGMLFELDRKTDRGLAGPPLFNTFGTAEVFYSGNSYSLARIVQSKDVIQKGFMARYRP
jgi:hypothetical protein